MGPTPPATGRTGLTLIETLVAVAIVAVLMGLVLPAIQQVRAAAARTRCANNLRQIGLAHHQYHQAHGVLPPGNSYRNGKSPQPHMSWCTRLLPYLEQDALWQNALAAFTQDRDFRNDPPHLGVKTVLPVFLCPADSRTVGRTAALLAYLGVEGKHQNQLDGVLFIDSAVPFADIRDGLSSTLLVGERPPSAEMDFGWWYGGSGMENVGTGDHTLGVRAHAAGRIGVAACDFGPYYFVPGRLTNQCDLLHFWSVHPGGAFFAFCDGSVRFLAYSADAVMPALASRSGGEAIAAPE
ncbi:MAG: DUF1559 domain-containing protein [Gemmataceae bacterium]